MSDDLVRRRAALVRRLRMDVEPSEGDMEDAADLIESQSAEIARLRADLATARREGMEEAAQMMIDLRQETTWEEHPEYGQICVIRNRTSEEIAAAIRAAAGASPGEYLTDAEQDRDEFFNRLGRITEYLDIPVDATAQRIIEAIQERIDNEREACASVEVRLTVPEGAETWTPLEAWEEALLAFDEAFRDAIRAAAKEEK